MSITSHGYNVIYIDKKQVYEHRHIMEQHLGRKLKKGENIHHINGNKLDNRIDNLRLYKSLSEHTAREKHFMVKSPERYKKCITCNKTFYATFKDKRFCSKHCWYEYKKNQPSLASKVRKLGLSYSMVNNRIWNGWKISDAMTEPKKLNQYKYE